MKLKWLKSADGSTININSIESFNIVEGGKHPFVHFKDKESSYKHNLYFARSGEKILGGGFCHKAHYAKRFTYVRIQGVYYTIYHSIQQLVQEINDGFFENINILPHSMYIDNNGYLVPKHKLVIKTISGDTHYIYSKDIEELKNITNLIQCE
ncbi:MAG: hypothetical protein IKT40_12355 [Bacilli bacterium]|nr:hypothetical protein [Bacilli bacterium]